MVTSLFYLGEQTSDMVGCCRAEKMIKKQRGTKITVQL